MMFQHSWSTLLTPETAITTWQTQRKVQVKQAKPRTVEVFHSNLIHSAIDADGLVRHANNGLLSVAWPIDLGRGMASISRLPTHIDFST